MKRICFFFLLVLANFYSFAQVDSFRPVYDEEKQDFYNRISRYKELSDAKIYFTSDIIGGLTMWVVSSLATGSTLLLFKCFERGTRKDLKKLNNGIDINVITNC